MEQPAHWAQQGALGVLGVMLALALVEALYAGRAPPAFRLLGLPPAAQVGGRDRVGW